MLLKRLNLKSSNVQIKSVHMKTGSSFFKQRHQASLDKHINEYAK